MIASVGGQKLPAVDAYIAGYQYCAKKSKPGTKTLNDYSQDFVDQAKCKEIALNQIQQKADVVFQVAGGCGLGALQAAKENKDWGIGVDADQAYLGNHILTSAQKKVDVGVFNTIALAGTSKWKGGVDSLFNAKNNGVGYGKVSTAAPSRAGLIALLDKWQRTSPRARSSRRAPSSRRRERQQVEVGGPRARPPTFRARRGAGLPPCVPTPARAAHRIRHGSARRTPSRRPGI